MAPMPLMGKGGHSELGENVCEQAGAEWEETSARSWCSSVCRRREDGVRSEHADEFCNLAFVPPTPVAWVRLCCGTACIVRWSDGDPVTLRAVVLDPRCDTR